MPLPPIILRETDHLTRIHIALRLEDVGFVVSEDGEEIVVETDPKVYEGSVPRCN